jgi:hypothetical protein
MLLLDASLDLDDLPFWAHVVFGLVGIVPAFEYGLGFRILGPIFRCEYSDSLEDLDMRTRRIRFGMGWFGIAIPSLFLVLAIFE